MSHVKKKIVVEARVKKISTVNPAVVGCPAYRISTDMPMTDELQVNWVLVEDCGTRTETVYNYTTLRVRDPHYARAQIHYLWTRSKFPPATCTHAFKFARRA